MKTYEKPAVRPVKRYRRTLPVIFGFVLVVVALCGTAAYAWSAGAIPRLPFMDDVTVTLSVTDVEAEYDGREHSCSIEGQTSDGTVVANGSDGKPYKVAGLLVETSATRPSESVDKVFATGNVIVTDEGGRDVTDSVEVKVDPGSLVISPRDLWLTSDSGTKPFDGTPLENGDHELAREEGFVRGEGASYEFSGSQTIPGTSTNRFDIIWDKGTDASCYEVHQEYGTLTVEPLSGDDRIDVTLSGSDSTCKFDFEEHEYSAVDDGKIEFESGGVNYVATGVVSKAVRGRDVGVYDSEISGSDSFAIYAESDKSRSVDLSSQFDVTFEPGHLRITEGDLYLGTFFGSNEDWRDTVYLSRDCEKFYAIGEAPNEGRDPSIMFYDGRFWVMTCRNDEDGYIWLVVSSSEDLVTWTHDSVCGPFTVDELPDAGGENFNVVAPEWFQDSDGSIWVTISCGFWGENHGVPTQDAMQSYLMRVDKLYVEDEWCRLESNGAFEKLSINADGGDRIDAQIFKVKKSYYLTVKCDGLVSEIWKSKSLDKDSWKRVVDKALYGFEGNCVVGIGKKYSMFVDGVPDVVPYGVQRYVADSMTSEWKPADVSFFGEYGAPAEGVRHGTVIAIDPENPQYKALSSLLVGV